MDNIDQMTSTMEPEVSVIVCTYQHVNYIERCLDGILSQVTDFPFEIILGEDESSDGTREKCIKYAEDYPDKIRLFLRSREDVIFINGRATGRYNFISCYNECKGRYIAVCDGDDCWTDVHKLQLQYNFLAKNKDYSVIGDNAYLLFENHPTLELVKSPLNCFSTYTAADLIEQNPFIHSMTMYKALDLERHNERLSIAESADWEILAYCATKGKCGFRNQSVGYYRIHSKSITYNSRKIYFREKQEFLNRIIHAAYWNKYTACRYSERSRIIISNKARNLIRIALKNNDFRTAIYFVKYVKNENISEYKNKIILKILKILNRSLPPIIKSKWDRLYDKFNVLLKI